MLRDSAVVVDAPTSNTAAHDKHEKINSWVSFSLHGYGAPLGGPLGRRSSAINMPPLIPDKDKKFGESLVLDFRK